MNSQGLMIAPTLIYGPFSIVEVQIALTFVIDTSSVPSSIIEITCRIRLGMSLPQIWGFLVIPQA